MRLLTEELGKMYKVVDNLVLSLDLFIWCVASQNIDWCRSSRASRSTAMTSRTKTLLSRKSKYVCAVTIQDTSYIHVSMQITDDVLLPANDKSVSPRSLRVTDEELDTLVAFIEKHATVDLKNARPHKSLCTHPSQADGYSSVVLPERAASSRRDEEL
jgi:hypothetical protein